LTDDGQNKDAASVAKMIRSSIFNVTPASDFQKYQTSSWFA
jgi:hypothetical protein